MPTHQYIFEPTREFWTAASVNSRLPPKVLVDENDVPVLDDEGHPLELKANQWLDKKRPVEQMTWCPGHPMILTDWLVSDGGWIARRGCSCFNLYRPPLALAGDPAQATPWLEHIRMIYPDDAEHITQWLAHRVQRPEEKINHALVLGGMPGIGKDAMLEPVKHAIGPWNFTEVSPTHLMGRFNGFLKSVILRVNETHDLGDLDRYGFYEHMKPYLASPPDVLRVDEKNVREHAVFNVTGVLMTTNHKIDGLYLPADDRRHYVAWTDIDRADIDADHFVTLFAWYAAGGIGHVAAWLAAYDLHEFDAKAPPLHTPAFRDIVAAHRPSEDAEFETVLDTIAGLNGWPSIVSLEDLVSRAEKGFAEWLRDRRSSRAVPHRLDHVGYVAVLNPTAKSGLWVVNGRRQILYGLKSLTVHDRHQAVAHYLNSQGPTNASKF